MDGNKFFGMWVVGENPTKSGWYVIAYSEDRSKTVYEVTDYWNGKEWRYTKYGQRIHGHFQYKRFPITGDLQLSA